MKAIINAKTNNQNFTRVFNLTGIDRKTLKRWWDKREEYTSSRYKNSAGKLGSEKYTGKFPEMENDFYDEKKLTSHGNMVSPGLTLSGIWNKFDANTIVESFMKCGKQVLIILLIITLIFLSI